MYSFQLAPAFCEAELASLPRFFPLAFLLEMETLDLIVQVRSANRRRRAAILFPPVCLLCPAPFCVTESRWLRRAHEETQLHVA